MNTKPTFHLVTAYFTLSDDCVGYSRDFYVVADTDDQARNLVADYLTNEVCDEDEIDDVEWLNTVPALPPLPVKLADKLYEDREEGK